MAEYLINKGRGVTLAEVTIPGTAMLSTYMFRNAIKDTEGLHKVICHGEYGVMSEPDLDPRLTYQHREIEVVNGDAATLADVIREICKLEASRFVQNDFHLLKSAVSLFARLERNPTPGWRPDPKSSLSTFFTNPGMESIRITKIVSKPGVWHEGKLWRAVYTAHIVFGEIPQ